MTPGIDSPVNVLAGPNKFDLMVSLFDGKYDARRTVQFKIEGANTPITLLIEAVEREDGSGESWNIDGKMVAPSRTFAVRGCYSTKTREGSIKFIVPSRVEVRDGKRTRVETEGERQDLINFLTQVWGRR